MDLYLRPKINYGFHSDDSYEPRYHLENFCGQKFYTILSKYE